MAKSENFASPANLWGRPIPNLTGKPDTDQKKDKATRMRNKEEEYEDDDIIDDADAELEEDGDGPDIEEIEDDEAAYAEAATEEIGDEEETDDDETEYAPEEGDEVSAEDDDENVDAAVDVEDDEPVLVENKTGTKKKVSNMAEKKSGADHIRDEIERRQESGDSLRGVDIVAALAKKRVTVSAAQVSQLLKKAGVAPGKKGRPAAVAAGESRSRDAAKAKSKAEPAKELPRKTAKSPARGPSGSTTLPMGQLKAAAAFLDACDGCYDTAEEILAAHKQLESVLKR